MPSNTSKILNTDVYPASIPPRQCAAFSDTGDGPCLRDTHDLIQMGLALPDQPGHWQIVVEVPLCDQHDDLLYVVQQQVEPLHDSLAGHLPADYRVLSTFRMSVYGTGE